MIFAWDGVFRFVVSLSVLFECWRAREQAIVSLFCGLAFRWVLGGAYLSCLVMDCLPAGLNEWMDSRT